MVPGSSSVADTVVTAEAFSGISRLVRSVAVVAGKDRSFIHVDDLDGYGLGIRQAGIIHYVKSDFVKVVSVRIMGSPEIRRFLKTAPHISR